jgi:hypothetical protein
MTGVPPMTPEQLAAAMSDPDAGILIDHYIRSNPSGRTWSVWKVVAEILKDDSSGRPRSRVIGEIKLSTHRDRDRASDRCTRLNKGGKNGGNVD